MKTTTDLSSIDYSQAISSKGPSDWKDWFEWGPKYPSNVEIGKQQPYVCDGLQPWLTNCKKWQNFIKDDWDSCLCHQLQREIDDFTFDPKLGGEEGNSLLSRFIADVEAAHNNENLWPYHHHQ